MNHDSIKSSKTIKTACQHWAGFAFLVLCLSVCMAIYVPAIWLNSSAQKRFLEKFAERTILKERTRFWLGTYHHAREKFSPAILSDLPEPFRDSYNILYQDYLEKLSKEHNERYDTQYQVPLYQENQDEVIIPMTRMRLVLIGFFLSTLMAMVHLVRIRKDDPQRGLVLAGITAICGSLLMVIVSFVDVGLINYYQASSYFLDHWFYWLGGFWFVFSLIGITCYFLTIFLVFRITFRKDALGKIALILVLLPFALASLSYFTTRSMPDLRDIYSMKNKTHYHDELKFDAFTDLFQYRYQKLLEEHGFSTSLPDSGYDSPEKLPPVNRILHAFEMRGSWFHHRLADYCFWQYIHPYEINRFAVFFIVLMTVLPGYVFAMAQIVTARNTRTNTGKIRWAIAAIYSWPVLLGTTTVLIVVIDALSPTFFMEPRPLILFCIVDLGIILGSVIGLRIWLKPRRDCRSQKE